MKAYAGWVRSRRRSGNNAIEFALVMPTFILLVFGMMEYSWAFFMRTGVINSVRAGCRTAVVVHPDDDPAAVAEQAIEDALLIYTIDCQELNTTCQITTGLSGSSPSEQLDCEVEVNYEPIMAGLVTAPTQIQAATSMVLELQR